MPYNTRESHFIIEEFQREFGLSNVQHLLDLLLQRAHNTVNPEQETGENMNFAKRRYEIMRQIVFKKLVTEITAKRSEHLKSNMEMLETHLKEQKKKLSAIFKKAVYREDCTKYHHMYLPPIVRRKKKKSQGQMHNKNIKKRIKQKNSGQAKRVR